MGALVFSYAVGFVFTILVDVPLQNIDNTFIFPYMIQYQMKLEILYDLQR